MDDSLYDNLLEKTDKESDPDVSLSKTEQIISDRILRDREKSKSKPNDADKQEEIRKPKTVRPRNFQKSARSTAGSMGNLAEIMERGFATLQSSLSQMNSNVCSMNETLMANMCDEDSNSETDEIFPG